MSFTTELKALLSNRYSENTDVRNQHGAGFSYHACMPPDAVVYPQSVEEVSEILRICSRYRVPVIPFGAGTSIEGHIVATRGGISVDLGKMNRIPEINTADMYVTVQAGVTRNQLDEALKGTGFFFPIGPGVNATIGGMAATRASGTNAVRYGTMKDNVLSLTVVLPDGSVVKTGSKARKSSAGYDLTRLFIGSEGTLGIITDLTLKLSGYPESVYAAVTSFPTVEAAVNTAIRTIQQGVPVARVELLDATMMRVINRYSGLTYREEPTLFLEFHGSSGEVERQADRTRSIAFGFGAEGFVGEEEESARERLWKARTDAALAVQTLVPGCRLFSTDVCVPISRLAVCITETQRDIAESGLLAPILGHVGDGNFHLSIPVHPDDPDALAKARAVNERLVRRALEMEGTCTGEHGIGIGKLAYMESEHGPALAVMRSIKAGLDPLQIMNPGKLLPPSPF
ncbi:FAD-binding oxidoreductase [Larkinella soli]|uniref:FAD-binding oxidoreductase n=1 Tax=Larkinella soli TaxID=1770527 RepID=UPI000FFCA301|nr:FAD-linked oxidase C-terminal domain-containing protein [Larkinella soli]